MGPGTIGAGVGPGTMIRLSSSGKNSFLISSSGSRTMAGLVTGTLVGGGGGGGGLVTIGGGGGLVGFKVVDCVVRVVKRYGAGVET